MSCLEEIACLCEQLGPVFRCLRPKYMKFRFQNLENSREDKNGRRKTTFYFHNKSNFPIDFA